MLRRTFGHRFRRPLPIPASSCPASPSRRYVHDGQDDGPLFAGRRLRVSNTRGGVPLPVGWQEAVSPARGTYYFHRQSGVTQWELPTGPPTAKQLAQAHQMKYGEQLSQLKPGIEVELRNIQSAPQLNGKRGTCERWDSSSGKVIVRLNSGELKAVKAECVFAVRRQEEPLSDAQRPRHSQQNDFPANHGISWKTIVAIGSIVYVAWIWMGRTGHVAYDPTGGVHIPDAKRRPKSDKAASQAQDDAVQEGTSQESSSSGRLPGSQAEPAKSSLEERNGSAPTNESPSPAPVEGSHPVVAPGTEAVSPVASPAPVDGSHPVVAPGTEAGLQVASPAPVEGSHPVVSPGTEAASPVSVGEVTLVSPPSGESQEPQRSDAVIVPVVVSKNSNSSVEAPSASSANLASASQTSASAT
eukprot:TRINITY_DN1233_c0_g1_i1.p1 TRINITY_DN1233_c0_g1~~TRINITY_DN1233_c0_g1_i1.p1  ORF type:complete len:427 (+),score=41.00 TRINITY_DN1233_c0_g1_i1:44-1282(+)